MFCQETLVVAADVIDRLRANNRLLAVAESCTGGLMAAAITEIAGSSDVFDRGFVTYSNAAKEALLGVSAADLEKFGAVSREVAAAMARGAVLNSAADIAISVTGIAGPSGGSLQKPVGYVWFGVCLQNGGVETDLKEFGDIGRTAVRLKSVHHGLEMIQRLCQAI